MSIGYKAAVVFGLGRAGLASIQLLLEQGVKTYISDDNIDNIKRVNETYPDAVGASVDDLPWGELDALVLAPGVPLNFPKPHAVVLKAREHNIPIVCDVELLFHVKHPDSKIVAITGTNGKSTTTALIHHILKEAGKDAEVGGNIGVAASTLPHDKPYIYVLELSSYQLELMQDFVCDVAVLLNITPDHLDRHGGMAGYIKAKEHIFDHQNENHVAVIGTDNPASKRVHDKLKETYYGKLIGFTANDEPFDIPDIPQLQGPHQRQNIIAAVYATQALGVSEADIIKGLQSFEPLPHRMQLAGKYKNITFINDSKATNLEAAKYALQAADKVIWIAGGRAKEGDNLEDVTEYFSNISTAYLIGEAADSWAPVLKNYMQVKVAGNLEAAVPEAANEALGEGGDVTVLFSPGCASFDQFKDFEHRGDTFTKLVKEWVAGQND